MAGNDEAVAAVIAFAAKEDDILAIPAFQPGTGPFGNGMAGIQEATQMVTSYFDPATKLIYAIGAVIAAGAIV